MSPTSSHNPAIDKLVERQMRNWEIARSQQPAAPEPSSKAVERFLTISRAVGAGGADGAAIAARLGRRLGWPVFNKQILHAMADDDRIRTQLYASMDERDVGWVEESLRSLVQGPCSKNDYFHRLTHTILALARQSHAVFVGRGADLILPRAHGLRVRLTAPRERCLQHYAEHHRLPIDQARTEVERIETQRAEFVRRHFGIEADQQSRYDLIINVQRLTPDQTVNLIVAALDMRTNPP